MSKIRPRVIRGLVTDATGGVVPGTTVVAVNEQTQTRAAAHYASAPSTGF